MANTYRHSFVNPYPNGWKNEDISQDTPIDAEALQAHTDAIKAIDNFLDGVNKDQIGSVQMRIMTMAEWLLIDPATRSNDNVIYFITDGGSGVNYPNYESEGF